MALTASIGSGGGIPGLTLRAWALIQGGTSNLLKGYNVSSVALGAAGIYTLNIQTAMPDANVIPVLQCADKGGAPKGQQPTIYLNSATAAAVTVSIQVNSLSADPVGTFWVALYG